MTTLLAPLRSAAAALTLAWAVPCLAVIGAGTYLVVLSPIRARMALLEVHLAALAQEVAHARAAAQHLARYGPETIELEGRLKSIARKLPTEREIPPLYHSMYDAAASTGLAVALFQPRDPRIQDYYIEIPIAVTAEGTYHQLGEFLERVAGFPRLVTVSTLRMTGLERPAVSMRAEMTLITFVYRPVGAPPPTPASATPRHRLAAARGRRIR
jgi:type IV pilus assembly protein PilO